MRRAVADQVRVEIAFGVDDRKYQIRRKIVTVGILLHDRAVLLGLTAHGGGQTGKLPQVAKQFFRTLKDFRGQLESLLAAVPAQGQIIKIQLFAQHIEMGGFRLIDAGHIRKQFRAGNKIGLLGFRGGGGQHRRKGCTGRFQLDRDAPVQRAHGYRTIALHLQNRKTVPGSGKGR